MEQEGERWKVNAQEKCVQKLSTFKIDSLNITIVSCIFFSLFQKELSNLMPIKMFYYLSIRKIEIAIDTNVKGIV